MIFLLFLFGAFFAFGLFMIFANVLKIPSLKTSKAVMTAGREDKKISKTIDTLLVETAGRIGKIFRMDKYKRNRLEKTLRSAGIKMTPKAFTVYAMLKALGICLLAVPCSFLFPLVISLIVILAVAVYFKEIGKRIICLDPEIEYRELTENLGGCFIDLMTGEYIINVLEPKSWSDGDSDEIEDTPKAFVGKTRLSQHISFYLFLTNLTAVEYIRNFMKRVRKKESAVILASQNIEDFLVENVRELTKPLFSIPTHHFLFNAGTIDSKFYIDALQLEPSEFSLIRYPQRGVCLYKCGNERYCLCVHAPEHKEKLFGSAGGR